MMFIKPYIRPPLPNPDQFSQQYSWIHGSYKDIDNTEPGEDLISRPERLTLRPSITSGRLAALGKLARSGLCMSSVRNKRD